MHAESPRFRRFEFAEAKLERVAEAVIGSGGGIALVAVEGEEIVGMAVAVVTEHWFSTARLASDLLVYVRPAYRGGRAFFSMVRELVAQASGHGCAELQVGVSTEIDTEATAGLLERLGFRRSTVGMVRDV